MSDTTVARRYAGALHEEAHSSERVVAVAADVVALRESIEASTELRLLLASPVVSADKKRAVVERLFADRFDPLVVRLTTLLIEKGREALLPDVLDAYERLRLERLGQEEAIVRTALPLGDAEQEQLRRGLEDATGKTIVMKVEVDPDLISGLVVRVGDTVYDSSGRNYLKTLREQFAARKFVSN